MIKKYFFTEFIIIFIVSFNFTVQLKAQEKKVAPNKSFESILFIGNSFTFGYGSPVRYYRYQMINDLNGTHSGGVPSLFKIFTTEARCDFDVSIEALPGQNLDYHYNNKANIIGKSWDHVILQGYSVLDKNKPGDPTLLIKYIKKIVELLKSKNPYVDVLLESTWSRADQTYEKSGFWYGQAIEKMALDIRKGYNQALTECSHSINGIIPVGEAWNRAICENIADPNPYDGINAGQINLWSYDDYHASAFGYYLDALMIFGSVTCFDPRSLGKQEVAAHELGFSPEQTVALQQIAYEELTANNSKIVLRSFIPVFDISEEKE